MLHCLEIGDEIGHSVPAKFGHGIPCFLNAFSILGAWFQIAVTISMGDPTSITVARSGPSSPPSRVSQSFFRRSFLPCEDSP
jgi:hypothetical protein